uniref:Uncharacterized protein n=1 Tax=Setaria digitata TaxID=48799 RepID=A0A915Q617_9BILA
MLTSASSEFEIAAKLRTSAATPLVTRLIAGCKSDNSEVQASGKSASNEPHGI